VVSGFANVTVDLDWVVKTYFSCKEEVVLAKTKVTRRKIIANISLGSLFGLIPRPAFSSISGGLLRLHDHQTYTRFVIELDQGLHFEAFTLANPNRVVIDFPEIDWGVDENSPPPSTGIVQAVRYGLFQPGNSRVVLDLSAPGLITNAFLLRPTAGTPWRFVLDLKPTTVSTFLSRQGDKNKISNSFGSDADEEKKLGTKFPESQDSMMRRSSKGAARSDGVPVPKQKPNIKVGSRKPVIVIDPGHGGVDPGAIGVSGTYEKSITLAAARQLKSRLAATGKYKAILTRNRDVSLRLRNRILVARRAGADIFVSLHADSIGNRNTRGLSVYTLSENASDKEAAALADRENKADLIIGMDLSNESSDVLNILIDLAQRESLNRAARLAAHLITQLRKVVNLLRNTHRFAGFTVLKAPDIPSVLVEMGYLSNRVDEKALLQPSYRLKLVSSIVQALDKYFAEE